MAKQRASAGKFVGITVSAYVPGMENDATFAGVMFRVPVPEAEQGRTDEAAKARNSLRGKLASEVCKKYNVKPLGAVSAPAGKITKTDIGLIEGMKMVFEEQKKAIDYEKIAAAFNKKTGKSISLEEVQAILAE